MNRIIVLTFQIVFTCLNLFADDVQHHPRITIVPNPHEVFINVGEFQFDSAAISYKLFVEDTTGTTIGINELKNTLKQFRKIDLTEDVLRQRDINIGIVGHSQTFDEVLSASGISKESIKGNEGYTLFIDTAKIVIAANDKPGLYYGIQSLKQLIRGNRLSKTLPCVKIIDYPIYKYRATMDDISRGPLPTLDYMKYQVRRLAELKMNQFMHYVEHVVKTEKHGEFAPKEAITIDEWKELSEYAKKYFVTIVGNFQSFGHFKNILDHPKYAHLGESGNLLSPVLDESIAFLKDVYSEMVPAFDAPWFSVNCDETFDLGRGYSKEMVEKEGYANVYLHHIMNIYNVMNGLGERTQIWGDILLKYPELIDKLPKDIVIGTWNYDAFDNFDKFIKPFLGKGFDLVVCPGVLNSRKITPDYEKAFININHFLRDGNKPEVVGMLNCVWDDGGSAFFSRDWYGVAYGADQSWNPGELDIDDFSYRYNRAINADTSNVFTEAIWKLNTLKDISATGGLNEKILWTELIPERGEKIKFTLNEWDEVKSVCSEVLELLSQNDMLLNSEEVEYFEFTTNLINSLATKRFNLLDAADSYRKACFIQRESKDSAEYYVSKSLDYINNTLASLQYIDNTYEDLWLRENKIYALYRVLNRFNKEIQSLQEIQYLLNDALNDIADDHFIQPPLEVRLDISEVSGKYFREWMMINPIPVDNFASSLTPDYLVDMGGEAMAKPRVTQEFYYNNQKFRWRRVVSDQFDIVNLAQLFPNTGGQAIMYAHAMIDSKKDRTVRASVGSDDGIKVFVNGEEVFVHESARTILPDEDEFNIKLKKGRNHLLIKASQLEGEWAFTFRLPGNKFSNSKNRYKIIE